MAFVYYVVNEGEVKFASYDRDEAISFANEKNDEDINDVLEDWGYDDEDDISEKRMNEAAFQAGYDGSVYEVHKIDLSKHSEDDTIKLDDGTEIDVSDIIESLNEK